MSRLAGFLAALTSEENDYFLRSFEALGVAEATWSAAEPDPVIARFGEVMLGAARTRSQSEKRAWRSVRAKARKVSVIATRRRSFRRRVCP